MVNKRIVKPIFYRSRKFIKILLIKMIRQRRYYLFFKHLVHKPCDYLVVHAISDNVFSGKISTKNKACMCPVKYPYLAMLIWHNIGNNMYINPRSLKRKPVLKFFGPLNYPNTEYLSDIDKLIVISVFIFKPCNLRFIPDSAGNNPVDKS